MITRLLDLGSQFNRLTVVPLLVRVMTCAAGVVANLLAWPGELLYGRVGLLLLATALLAAVAPRARVVTLAVLMPVIGWLAATAGYHEPVVPWRVVALATALYLMHAGAALAAQLPHDAIVAPVVVARWALRAVLVVAGTVVVAVFTVAAGGLLRQWAFVAATFVGFAVAVALAAVLSRLIRR